MADAEARTRKAAFEYFEKHPALTADDLVQVPFWPTVIVRAALAAAFAAVGCYLIARFLGPEFTHGRKDSKIMIGLVLVGGFIAGLVSFVIPATDHPLQSTRGSSAGIAAAFATA